MPIYTIGLPDGREAEIEAPEGATEAEVLAYVEQQWNAGAFKAEAPAASQAAPEQPKTNSFGEGLVGLGETGLAMLTGMGSSAVAGAKNLADIALGQNTLDEAAEDIRKFQEEYTYAPKTESGQAIMGGIAKPFMALDEGMQSAGESVLDATGSPALATATYMAPDIVGTIFGLGAMRQLKAGTQLKKGGLPTRELQDALNKHGIVYDNLTPQAKAAIPDVAPKTLVTGKPKIDQTANKAIATDINTGGTQSGLAKFQTYGGEKLFDDAGAQETLRQGWAEGDVQMVKTASPETKRGMNSMLKIMERVQKNSKLSARPSDIVGMAAQKRLKFIAKKADQARIELDKIALGRLAGKQIDSAPIANAFTQKMKDLGVGFKVTEGGKVKFNFKGSVIQADKSSQRVIKQLADLLSTGGKPDALRFHLLKRQIDALIDWNKQPTQGITKEGKNVLKKVRAELNQALRDSDPQYARVNDTLSTSLKLFDQIDDATASRINVQTTLDDPRAMGQELRKLFTNYQSRVDLENAIRDMDKVTNQLQRSTSKEVGQYLGEGVPAPVFSDSVYELARFANSLDEQFGAVARGSLQGRMESAVKHGTRAATQGMTSAVTQGVGEKAMELAQKLRKIDNYHAYRSMEELLKRGAK